MSGDGGGGRLRKIFRLKRRKNRTCGYGHPVAPGAKMCVHRHWVG